MTATQSAEATDLTLATDVLVVGGGYAAARAAAEIAARGYKAVLVDERAALTPAELETSRLLGTDADHHGALAALADRITADPAVEIHHNTRLVSAAGMPGDFTVHLAADDGATITRSVGAVVLTRELSLDPQFEAYGLTPSERVLSQSNLEASLAGDPDALAGKTVAFLLGFAEEGTPLGLERVLRSVTALGELAGTSVYVYVNNLKVAADGLEKRYKAGRDKGAIYFKLRAAPHVAGEPPTVSFTDPVLRRDVILEPDLIVVEERLAADPVNVELADALRIDRGDGGFLQGENVHMLPVRTNREGIFVAGASRDVRPLGQAFTDIAAVTTELCDLLGQGCRPAPAGRAVVDRERCAICLTCYRVCPHGAICWDDKAVINPLACQGCGICASECPQDAIQVDGFADADLLAAATGSWDAVAADQPRIVAFCCQNSAYEAGRMAGEFGLQLPPGLKMVRVPCAGKIDLEYVMNAFAEGTDGVLVFTCHTGNCKSERGNIYAGWRSEMAQRLLSQAGLEADRLQVSSIASNMGSEFAAVVNAMAARLKELGPSPVR